MYSPGSREWGYPWAGADGWVVGGVIGVYHGPMSEWSGQRVVTRCRGQAIQLTRG